MTHIPHPQFSLPDQYKSSIFSILSFDLLALSEFPCLSALVGCLEGHIVLVVAVYIVEASGFASLSMTPSDFQAFSNAHLPLTSGRQENGDEWTNEDWGIGKQLLE